jgi:hypothetical protein
MILSAIIVMGAIYGVRGSCGAAENNPHPPTPMPIPPFFLRVSENA